MNPSVALDLLAEHFLCTSSDRIWEVVVRAKEMTHFIKCMPNTRT